MHRGALGVSTEYLLQARLYDGPDTILVATSLHELKTTPKPG